MMKIKIVDSNTKQPVTNRKIPLQIKGKDSGFLSLMTDQAGCIQLDDKYTGQQISSPAGGGQATWISATNGATLYIATKTKATESSNK